MADHQLPKVCVVLGAGASHDVRGPGSLVVTPGLRPPLACDLFNFEKHGAFRPILAEYDGAWVLAQGLASRSLEADFDLEKELSRIAKHPRDQMRKHYKHIPPYLRDLLLMCSYQYTSYPSSYIQLVQALLDEVPSDVLFLVLNYDDLLEQALYQFTSGTTRFESLDDYIRPDRHHQVIKLHGSINWFKPIGSGSAPWKAHVAANADLFSKCPDNEIHVTTQDGKSDPYKTYDVQIGGQRGYPLLTAPLAGKGVSAMVCPESHLASAKEFLKDCSRFLIIGSSGRDDDLLELLNESITTRSTWVQWVGGSEDREPMRLFQTGVQAFRSVKSPGDPYRCRPSAIMGHI